MKITKRFCLDVTILDKQEITKKVIFSAYGKSLAEKHVLFFNQNRGRYKILVETKKFRLDGTISNNKNIRRIDFFRPTVNY